MNSTSAGGVPRCAATLNASPSKRISTPNLASQIRVAFSSRVWKTASRSPGDLEDHLEHIGGGGLLLKGFAQLVEEPCILDGDDGLLGKILTSSICLSVKGRTSWR